jgi:hypothetical protein
MANWNNPTLSSTEVNALNEYKNRDIDNAVMFDAGTITNIPDNAIRFNVASGVFQRREGGSWVTKPLTSSSLANSGVSAGSYGTNIAIPVVTVNAQGIVTNVSTVTPRSATTSQTGVVQLNNTISSTSTTQAATANAVKTANDAAVAANSNANTRALASRNINTSGALSGGGNLTADRTLAVRDATTSVTGVVQLNNTVSSTSTTQAATANAVKTLNDTKVPNTRTITTGTGLSGGGDLSANRTLSTDTNQSHVTEIAGSTSSTSSITGKTNTGTRQVNVSFSSDSTAEYSQVNASTTSVASGNRSQVNASVDSTASGNRSQVNASDRCLATAVVSQINVSTDCSTNGVASQINVSANCSTERDASQVNVSNQSTTNGSYSQINASTTSTTDGSYSQVNSSEDCAANGDRSQVNASTVSFTSGTSSQVNASTGSTASNDRSQVNASINSTASGIESQVNASSSSSVGGTSSQVNASFDSTANGIISQVNASSSSSSGGGTGSQVNASLRVINTTSYSSVWGYAVGGDASTANQQIRLESATGVGRFKGNTTTGGFDYAEYFPNLESGIIPDGTIVTLAENKVRPAQEGDFILGTISATAGVIGNSAEFCWEKRYLKDEFGRTLYEPAEFVKWDTESEDYDGLVSECKKDIPEDAEYYTQDIPIQNPEYKDISSDYKPRGDRKEEWSVVGLMGQVYTRVYEDLEFGDYISAEGTKSDVETRLYVMKMTTPYDASKGYGVAFALLRS